MTQLRITRVDLKIVSRNSSIASPPIKPSTANSANASSRQSPSSGIAMKAQSLHEKAPGAAAVIEGLIDDLLWQFEGRKL